jgi:hypothetical protein
MKLVNIVQKYMATKATAYGCLRGRKCASFVNLSTITKIQLLLSELGNPSMKSIVIIYQASSRTGRGPCNRSRLLDLSGLACWHVTQDRT